MSSPLTQVYISYMDQSYTRFILTREDPTPRYRSEHIQLLFVLIKHERKPKPAKFFLLFSQVPPHASFPTMEKPHPSAAAVDSKRPSRWIARRIRCPPVCESRCSAACHLFLETTRPHGRYSTSGVPRCHSEPWAGPLHGVLTGELMCRDALIAEADIPSVSSLYLSRRRRSGTADVGIVQSVFSGRITVPFPKRKSEGVSALI